MRFVSNAPWPDADVEKLIAWRAEGIGNTEIAARLRRTEASVSAKVRKLKLPPLTNYRTPPVRQRVRAPESQAPRAGKSTLPPLASLRE